MIPWLDGNQPFPPVHRALEEPNGLLAAGGDFPSTRLLEAYRHGIFPWYSEGQPVLWWSPDPRMVLVPGGAHDLALAAQAPAQRATTRCASIPASREVMRACAEPRDGQAGTWITDEMVARLRGAASRAAIAHSVETWIDGELAGGLYGVALGRMFFGESMFTRATDASKIALAHLARQLERWEFGMIDCQMTHAASRLARRARDRRGRISCASSQNW